MRKLIISTSTLLAVIAIVAGVTTAFYNDVETSSGNTLSAGAVDLGIDNESYYNGAFNPETSWLLDWDLDPETNPDGLPRLFFNFLDLKPGDWGEDTISLHVDDNDAWACMAFNVTADEDNGSTEPELDDEDPYTADDGELDDFINFVWWADDGDNVLENTEMENGKFQEGTFSDIGSFSVALADATGDGIFQGDNNDPLEGDVTYYIGKAWCFGNMELDPVDQDGLGKTDPVTNGPIQRGPGITCDGAPLDNSTQTDKLTADVVFTALQERHNPGFKCEGGIGCLDKADVMLVIDNSGSISSGELSTMKTAAIAFTTALGPTTDGVNMGVVNFNSSATLQQGLTGTEATVVSAINAISTSNGLTNLEDGIRTAQLELDNNDRPDGEAPDIMVIITDGAPTESDGPGTHTEDAADAASDAQSAGTEIFAVGVGITAGNAQFMKDEIVSPPSADHYFDSVDFDQLSAILADIASCQ